MEPLGILLTVIVFFWLGFLLGRGNQRKMPRRDTHYAKFKVIPFEKLKDYVKP